MSQPSVANNKTNQITLVIVGLVVIGAIAFFLLRGNASSNDIAYDSYVFVQQCEDLVKTGLAAPATAEFPSSKTVQTLSSTTFAWKGTVNYKDTANKPRSEPFSCITQDGTTQLEGQP